ncbi:hypothetical protein PV10_07685 [Exophiala mesophila]|uniref:Major facilitator superfamily (MFS) profile domain-containing protein n=1 Tax=Exophiala mesophila TaxID=212818 RepID=A0A0D1XQJ9_EXOME|nr:uncharacterized protein PV10_07685 [Exophiala mesophila]KIV90376.1 hypothetical protein PV10_07685 [Exophiala mesophila]
MSAQSETSPAKQTQDANTPNQSLPIHEFEIKDDEIEVEEIKGIKLFTIMLALCLAVFCVALDNTIIATAIPHITNEFETVQDIGWYGSAYFLTTCVCQPVFGTLYSSFDFRGTFLFGLAMFEIGSLVCGVARASSVFIVGRAIAGLGAAGIISGPLVLIARILPMSKRPQFSSLILSMWGFASVAGPLMGGAMSDRATWRWCFFINLPVGLISTVLILWLLHLPQTDKQMQLSFINRVKRIDFLGMVTFMVATICLLLALQWGGTAYSWSNARIIVLFCMFGFLTVAFVVIQIWKGDAAIVPPKVAGQRSIAFAALFSACLGGGFFFFVYYIPFWFQAVSGASATESGLDNVPLMLSQAIGTVVSGALTARWGHYMPFVMLSVVLMSTGAGLITTFSIGMPASKWIGYQILYGLGVGVGFQQPQIAVQAILSSDLIAIGISLMFFTQLLGGAVFLAIGQNVFANRLVAELSASQVPGLDPIMILESGATEFRHGLGLQADQILVVIQAYATALVASYRVGLIVSCLAMLGALGMKWKSIKGLATIEVGM